jgi:hypothetical protein
MSVAVKIVVVYASPPHRAGNRAISIKCFLCILQLLEIVCKSFMFILDLLPWHIWISLAAICYWAISIKCFLCTLQLLGLVCKTFMFILVAPTSMAIAINLFFLHLLPFLFKTRCFLIIRSQGAQARPRGKAQPRCLKHSKA